jgi:predicted transcriptional regulator
MRAVLAENGDNYSTLSDLLGIPQSAVSNRINGVVDFRASEISRIRKRYNLTDEKTAEIFFDTEVSA